MGSLGRFMMSLRIIQLNQNNLDEAIALSQKVFSHEDYEKDVGVCLRESLELQSLEKSLRFVEPGSKKYRETRKTLDEFTSKYWVSEDLSKIAGLTGLAWSKSDRGKVWLGWFCVDPDYRGRGIGSRLLDHTINQAGRNGFREFRVWTSTLPSEREAQKLYESRGLIVYEKERIRKNKTRKQSYTHIYRRLRLTNVK
ncbi:MAG: GNAT family N-acetyltransferase [Nanoarchaeota archaeon]|nr:GNAT family N-acetyltransferase [Nanoarchaeota archaeon]